MFDHSDPYRLLGVARGTPMGEVRAAYRRRLADPRRPTYSPEEQLRFVTALEAIERERRALGDPEAAPTPEQKSRRRNATGLAVYAACFLIAGVVALTAAAPNGTARAAWDGDLLATGLSLTAAAIAVAILAFRGPRRNHTAHNRPPTPKKAEDMYPNAQPPGIESIIAQAGLGQWRARYQPRPAPIGVRLGVALGIYLLVVLLFASTGFLATGYGLVFFLVFTAFIGLGVANLAHMKRKSQAGDALDFFDEGLIVKGPKARVQMLWWDDARVFQQLFHYPTTGLVTFNYLLVDQEGNAVSIGDPKGAASSAIVNLNGNLDRFVLGAAFEGPEIWGPIIQDQITRAQLPKVLAEIEAGRRVDFGHLSIDRDGITADGNPIPWPDLQAASVQDGVVLFNVRGRFLRTREPVYTIANFFVFKAAVQVRSGITWT
ncbi:DUF6585 family protein [Glycomyces paridis]|uniref:Uncharacterized protein n=1 Tax=Glycomyces paridis TaxID=2126555 RepID=A0A4S8PEG2_9ACTN|nr:DUF6585 family protein [Glycomyces paridis]THV28757.1 hypothetical protein E9998_11700 [Glycomyces paridis]